MLRFWVASILIAATCIFPSERQCSVFGAISVSETLLSQQMNGNAPFFQAFFGVFGDIERICSVFHAVFMPFFGSKVGGLNRSEWVGMLRFRQVGDFVRIPQLLTWKTHACQAQMPMKGGLDAPVFILNQASKLAADLRLLKIHTESQAKLE